MEYWGPREGVLTEPENPKGLERGSMGRLGNPISPASESAVLTGPRLWPASIWRLRSCTLNYCAESNYTTWLTGSYVLHLCSADGQISREDHKECRAEAWFRLFPEVSSPVKLPVGQPGSTVAFRHTRRRGQGQVTGPAEFPSQSHALLGSQKEFKRLGSEMIRPLRQQMGSCMTKRVLSKNVNSRNQQ